MSVDDLIAQNKEKQKKKMEKMQKKGVSSDTLVKGASMKTKTLGDRQSSSGRAGGGGFGSFRDKANLGQSDTGKGKTASGGGAPLGGELKGSPPSGKSPGGRPPSGDPVTETKTGSSGGSKRSGKGSDDSSLRDKVFTAAATSSKNVKSKVVRSLKLQALQQDLRMCSRKSRLRKSSAFSAERNRKNLLSLKR